MIAPTSVCALCFMVAGKIATPSSGAKMTATAHDTSRAMATTVNIENVYSPAALFANPIGMKPTTVTSVPVSIGNAVDVYANVAARAESNPSSSLVTIISTVIIASSTSRPRAMMSAPSDTRCRSIPAISIATKTAASTSGMEQATTAPARRPRLRKLTPNTIAIASHSASMKSSTALSTTRG